MSNLPFIATSDEETAEKLRSLGFAELPKQNGRWMFVNENKVEFAQSDMKITFTDKLMF